MSLPPNEPIPPPRFPTRWLNASDLQVDDLDHGVRETYRRSTGDEDFNLIHVHPLRRNPMPKLRIADPDPAPLTCAELADRHLLNMAHCCQLCHVAQESGDSYYMRAVIIPVADGEVRAEICCSQALIINAPALLDRAAAISLEGLAV